MSRKDAAIAGVKEFGKDWRTTIHGVPDAMDKIRKGIEDIDQEAIEAGLRSIHVAFKRHVPLEDQRMDVVEAMEFMAEETVGYEIENNTLCDFKENFDHHMDVLYDFADYNRIWVKPDRAPKEEVEDAPSL